MRARRLFQQNFPPHRIPKHDSRTSGTLPAWPERGSAMITCDLHSHTCHSHARDTAAQMYEAALAKGLAVFGFSEHSPRPERFTYTREYRDRLNAGLPDYVREVKALQADGRCRVLFGMEIDWFESDQDFVRRAATQFDFDYLIGSVHFLGEWGFDDRQEDWDRLSAARKDECYQAYFTTWRKMIETGWFNIAAHPDLIKIFSVDDFHRWLAREASLRLVKEGLLALKAKGMAMEISSAGIRKPCREIYPCAAIMRMAADLGLDITFASDAHATEDVAHAFPRLATYARAFGFADSVVFAHGATSRMAF